MIGEILTLFALSILGGIKSIYGIGLWNGREDLTRIWTERQMYILSSVWMIGYVLVWIGFGREISAVRIADLLCTYMILAAVDGKRRIVPEMILLSYFAGQMLLGALSRTLTALLYTGGTGSLFAAAVCTVARLSKGKIGMGDAKLLGVTAMTAGWAYTLQILILAMALSFIYSIGLLLFCKKNMQDEFPFVPFLTAGVAIHLLFFVV